jgi:beta-glucosidase-like glycosyl hydrolase/CubicO group peptidase (beta-lactamase class C family)
LTTELLRTRSGRSGTGALLLGLTACATGPAVRDAPAPPSATLDRNASAWVERTLAAFTDDELIGQLVIEWIPGGYVSESSADFQALERLVAEYHVGGLLPSIGTPHAYAAKLNALQALADVPLLVASDFENGGPGMRINGAYALPSMLPQGGGTVFPPTMAFGAVGDPRFAFEYGRITALEARASGVHMLFAPVLDVNSNPENPVIATRSFAADPALVAELGAAFIAGARAGGAYATGKHFPGHGDTGTDSHVGLPVVGADRARLDRLELVPFVRAIDEGVDGIMTAHVQVPGVLGVGAPPATLSPEFLTGLLREDLGFRGLLLTDALTMRAITDMYGGGEAAVRAVEAGADVILSPASVPESLAAMRAALASGRLSRARLEQSARRILELKARLGLHRRRFVSLDRVSEVVGSGAHLAFADSAATRSITLVRDAQGMVPLARVVAGTTAHLTYAPSSMLWAGRTFSPGLLARIDDVVEVRLDERSDSAAYAAAGEALAGAARVIVSAYVPPAAGSRPEAVPESLRALVKESAAARPTLLVSFGSPYLLAAVPDVTGYLIAWGDREVSQRAALAGLLGEQAITGRLPIPLPPFHDVGDGLERAAVAAPALVAEAVDPLAAAGFVDAADRRRAGGGAQSLASPGDVGMSAEALARVDSIVRAALADSAASGAALAVGRHGRLVALGGYGELAYGSGRAVTPTSLFDLASVSKVVGTTSAVMMLVGDGRLDLDAPVVSYLPWWSRGDARKGAVTVRQLLLHRAGLADFRRWFFDLEGVNAYKDAVADEPLVYEPGAQTIYSDIGAMTLGWIVEQLAGEPLDAFLAGRLFAPLGMRETMYRPGSALLPRIAATELDTLWRRELVWGRVHDENADAMGGVAGHAGLFGTAVDLSVFARMMLSDGVAPACLPPGERGEPCPVARGTDRRIFDPEVLRAFTSRHDAGASRALGWDTPSEASSAGDYFTARAYGHTGFTGTSIWIDPELDLWVVLLTNRVHPTRENTRINALRRAVHDAVALAVTDHPVERRAR